MPNWCFNSLVVKGKDQELKKFKKAVKGKDTDLSFDKLVPMPKELKGTRSPSLIVPAKDYEKEVAKAKTEAKKNPELELSLPITRKIQKELIAKHGADNWYNWHLQNWGTKWDVRATLEEEEREHLCYFFDSAWSPPVGWLEKTAKLFPKLNFCLYYEEGGMGFKGEAEARGGKLIRDDCEDWDGHHDDE